MKKAILLCFVALLGFGGQNVYACSCSEVKTEKKVSYKRWLKEFDGAVFTGRVVMIEKIAARYELKVTFEVERFWKGVETPKMIIYTAIDGAACGVTYVEGENYLVIANRSGDKLYTDLCSWLWYSKNEKAFMKGLGRGKGPKT